VERREVRSVVKVGGGLAVVDPIFSLCTLFLLKVIAQ
jgi:hypothetical protein